MWSHCGHCVTPTHSSVQLWRLHFDLVSQTVSRGLCSQLWNERWSPAAGKCLKRAESLATPSGELLLAKYTSLIGSQRWLASLN